MQNQPKLLSTEEARQYLNISRTALNKYVACGDIPVVKFDRRNRFRREDLDAKIERSIRGEGKM